jgi:hypothetical protein
MDILISSFGPSSRTLSGGRSGRNPQGMDMVARGQVRARSAGRGARMACNPRRRSIDAYGRAVPTSAADEPAYSVRYLTV